MEITRIAPGPGQESVWDYPRPPRLEDSPRHVQVIFNGEVIADTHRVKRVLETSHPPVYYIPPEDIRQEFLKPSVHTTFCEFKGQAKYYHVVAGSRRAGNAAWYYPSPPPSFAGLKDHVAFYPSKMDSCLVDGEPITPQPGDFYGGWITSDIVGPFKGDPGTHGW